MSSELFEEDEHPRGSNFRVEYNWGGTVVQAERLYQTTQIGEIRQSYRSVPPVEIQFVAETYVRPPGYEKALETIRAGAIVVLVACPGRRSTSISLLRSIAEERSEPEFVLADLDAAFVLEKPDKLPVLAGHGFVLDVQDQEAGRLGNQILANLADYAQKLAGKGSCMVLTVSRELWPLSATALNDIIVELQPPDARTVAARHLERLRPENIVGLEQAPIQTLLTAQPGPADAAHLASLVAQADITQENWWEPVVTEYSGWRDHLTELFEKYEEQPDRRALLIAGAVLAGGPVPLVSAWADELLKETQSPQPTPTLASPALSTRLKEIGARTERGPFQFEITRPAYNQAVLDYVWNEFPSLRTQLLDWLYAVAAAKEVSSSAAADQPAWLLSSLVVRQHDRLFLKRVADAWAQSNRALTARILADAAESPEVGGIVRQRLYDWARERSDTALVLTIVEACARLWPTYSNVVLTRLRHVATRSDHAISNAVTRAMVSMARTRALRGQVLDEVVRWVADPERVQTGCQVFVALIGDGSDGEPSGLLPTAGAALWDQETLVGGWYLALAHEQTREQAADAAYDWLDHALAGTADRDRVLGLLAAVASASHSHASWLLISGRDRWRERHAPDGPQGQSAQAAIFEDFWQQTTRAMPMTARRGTPLPAREPTGRTPDTGV